MTVADLDLDRKPDVALANGPTSTVTVLLNPTSAPAAHTELAAARGGAAPFATAGGSSTMQVGYATATVDFGVVPFATGAFGLTQNGVVVSEAGVPTSVPTRSARIFVDRRTVPAPPDRLDAGTIDINTGVALVNLGPAPANLRFTLRDRAGATLATGEGTLDSGAHAAKFVDQLRDLAPNFTFPGNFAASVQFGSLEIGSDQPLAILALRLTLNQRGETLLTTTPLADLAAAPSSAPLYFPQWADGGGFTTSVILVNTSAALETGTLQPFADDGSPLTVKPVGGASAALFNYSIPAGGVYVLQSDGSPATTQVGWVRVTPTAGSAPVGAGIFQLSQGGIVVTEAGVPTALPTTRARIFVDRSAGHDTGLALALPGASAAALTMKAYQTDGTTPSGTTGTVNLVPNGHKADFVGQRVTGLPDGFRGVLEVSSATPFVALTLRSLVNGRGDFLITTFPVADLGRPAALPMVFPQAVDGEGYRTEFVFLAGLGEALATLNYFGDNGRPLQLDRR
jgi:hypothetical protein